MISLIIAQFEATGDIVSESRDFEDVAEHNIKNTDFEETKILDENFKL